MFIYFGHIAASCENNKNWKRMISIIDYYVCIDFLISRQFLKYSNHHDAWHSKHYGSCDSLMKELKIIHTLTGLHFKNILFIYIFNNEGKSNENASFIK